MPNRQFYQYQAALPVLADKTTAPQQAQKTHSPPNTHPDPLDRLLYSPPHPRLAVGAVLQTHQRYISEKSALKQCAYILPHQYFFAAYRQFSIVFAQKNLSYFAWLLIPPSYP